MNLVRRLAPLGLLLAAVAAAAVLMATRPEPEQAPQARPSVPVRTDVARRGLHRLDVHGQGVVVPARAVTVRPEVGGRVVELAPGLLPGALVAAGELLYRIDPRDYEIAVGLARSALAEARSALELEEGRRVIAEREWALFADELPPEQRDAALALREPQLAAARARVEAAEARLAQAELDLERTRVTAPFNALVRERRVEVGQTVGVDTPTAELVGSDVFWVRAAVAAAELPLVDIGTRARVSLRAGGYSLEREGQVIERLPDVDPGGRMARVIVAVPDPLGGEAPMLLESYVEVVFEGGETRELVRVPRSWLRNGDRIYLVDREGRLSIANPEIVWRGPEAVLVDDGLEDGDRVVTSQISAPVEGMPLDIIEGG